MTKEQKFFKALQNVFIGAQIEGEGGFVNLMRMKSDYYCKIEKILQKDIEEKLKDHPKFKEEMFDKLYSFFSRYFTESGSIYFNSTPFHNNIYEKVYTDERDVILFWKTQMLYYVKTDRIFRSLPVEFDGFKFFFDASKLESKKANEKRSPIFELKQVKDDGTIVFTVLYSERGTKNKEDEILKSLKKKGITISEEQVERAFRIFEKQSEVDYFVNKNAKEFLREQFKLWSYQYFWDGAEKWNVDRVNEIQALKDIAYKSIDFISQFEDELVKIWNKSKFVKNSNYVITLDRIKDKKLVEKIKKHKNFPLQIKEWKELEIDKENPRAPIDTKYFKDLELEILGLFDDLDKSLDGWLIKSENYQALNTILPKFKEKVQTIYIDPPFNTGEDFPYVDRFQDASWLSLMYDRVNLSSMFLRKEGNFYYHIDRYAYYYSRIMLNNIFGENNFKAEVAWDTCGITGFKPGKNNWVNNINYILHFSKSDENNFFTKIFVILEKEEKERLKLGWLDLMYDNMKEKYYIEKWNNILEKKYVETENKKHPVGMIWTDIYSFLFTQVGNNESFFFNTQKPEHLLRRMIQASSKPTDIVCDFFSGIGTTIAVAHKLNRKWIGVEMGPYFDTLYLDIVKLKKKKNQDNQDDLPEDAIEEDDPSIVEVLSETKGQKTVVMKKIGMVGRMKIVLSGDQIFHVFGHPRHPQLSRNINWQGGGFFKYYELEQYEEALSNCKYKDGDLFTKPNSSPYQEYVFMKDEKMLKALEIDYKNNEVKVDLSKLYPDIDIAETLSNLTGRWIKRISKDELEFEDGTKINTKDLDYKLIKPLIWW